MNMQKIAAGLTLEARLPGRRVATTGMSRAEKRVLVRTFSDKSLGACYLYDHAAGRLEKLAELSPWLNEAEMADVRPIQFMSRDGLTLHGYLTLPKGGMTGHLPIVVNPHGGYAVLAGLACTPDLYACGIDYVGVSNIFTLLETLPP